ncbi:hypothetical protein SUGI_0639000 [Cryptomeria japonica]|nr:hypothetical protein SUGI_0639000 [Cryptomeria japonica]
MEDPDRISKEVVDFFGNLWRRNGDGQPGLFQAFFFQFFWDFIGGELLGVVEESRSRGFVLKEFNCTLVALIPKKAKPDGLEEF